MQQERLNNSIPVIHTSSLTLSSFAQKAFVEILTPE